MNGKGSLYEHVSQYRSPKSRLSSVSYQYTATPGYVATLAATIATKTGAFNSQLSSSLAYCNNAQNALLDRTSAHISSVYSSTNNPTSSMLRDLNTWPKVKQLVIREELMKAQITGKLDISMPGIDEKEVLSIINNKDLTNVNDVTINRLIDRFITIDDKAYLDALVQYKNNGVVSDYLQQSKLGELDSYLNNVDLDKLTGEQYKHIKQNFFERPEYHHRQSISSDPSQQSNADNIDVLTTSGHDAKHYDSDTGKINYKKPVNENPLDRKNEMKVGNQKRVLKNELRGLGMAVAISVGIGFTMSMIAEFARVGFRTEEAGSIVFNSFCTGIESGIVTGATYLAGRGASGLLEKAGIDLLSKAGSAVNMGIVGCISTFVICTYQYVKARINGANSEEAFYVVKNTAVTSLSILTVSVIAQGIWGGYAGLIVSTAAGVMVFAYGICKSRHDAKIEERIRECSIEEYKNTVDENRIIYSY